MIDIFDSDYMYMLCFTTIISELIVLAAIIFAYEISFKKIWEKHKLLTIAVSCISVLTTFLPAFLFKTESIINFYLYLSLGLFLIANVIIIRTAVDQYIKIKGGL